jgi:hypothetical protein
MDDVATVELELEHAIEEREGAILEIEVGGGADRVLEGVRLGFVRVEFVGDENDLAHWGEVRVRGGVPADTFEDAGVADGAIFCEPGRTDGAMEKDGDTALESVDRKPHALGFFDELRTGDVAGDVVGGSG